MWGRLFAASQFMHAKEKASTTGAGVIAGVYEQSEQVQLRDYRHLLKTVD